LDGSKWEKPQSDRPYSDRRRHSIVLDIRSPRAVNCITNHDLVVAKVRERPAVNKQKEVQLKEGK
jgi:hypothetical protein